MAGGLRESARNILLQIPAALARLGLVDRRKGEEAFDLAIPVMVTGGMRTLLRVADFFMVSVALGDEAVAALELGFQYYFIPFGLALALSSGTISVVSRFYGAEQYSRANFAIKQSFWLALAIALPITAFTWVYAAPMIDVLTDDARTIELGAIYLQIVMLSATFRFWSLIAARALAGAGDTRTPMYIRVISLPTNVVLNAILIFGIGPFPALGIVGAAMGTALANVLAAFLFLGVLLSGRFRLRLNLGGKQWDTSIAWELVRVGLPLAGTRLSRTFGRFPFLFVLGVLGTEVIAAYAIGRRVMLLALMPAWGFSTASSTLVGQSLGAGDPGEANEYGWQTLRLALIIQIVLAVVIIAAARPIVLAFDASNVGLTVTFVRVFGLSVAGFAISRTMRGSLRGAGDTRWPLYGGLLGTYAVRLPIAAVALPVGFAIPILGYSLAPGLGFGLVAIYVAILADMYTRAIVNVARFASGAWKTIAASAQIATKADLEGGSS